MSQRPVASLHLKKLSNQYLLENIKILSAQERKITTEILHHLREIETRRLHLDLGFSSLFEYCLRDLKYSESQAQRRVSAMRLMKAVPEIESKIQAGSVSLSNAAKVHSFIRQSQKNEKSLNLDQVKELIEKIENKSTRECELELIKISPEQAVARSRERVINEEYAELKITINKELKNKLDTVKSLLSHQNPDNDLAKLLELLCDMAIKQKMPQARKTNRNPRELFQMKTPKVNVGRVAGTKGAVMSSQDIATSSSQFKDVVMPSQDKDAVIASRTKVAISSQGKDVTTPSQFKDASQIKNVMPSENKDAVIPSQFKDIAITSQDAATLLKDRHANELLLKKDQHNLSQNRTHEKLQRRASTAPQVKPYRKNNRYIPASIKHQVYLRDQGCCTFIDFRSNKKCKSRHLLQYDHIKPIAFNGETSVPNLRLLCFSHHKLVTEKFFGKKFINSLVKRS